MKTISALLISIAFLALAATAEAVSWPLPSNNISEGVDIYNTDGASSSLNGANILTSNGFASPIRPWEDYQVNNFVSIRNPGESKLGAPIGLSSPVKGESNFYTRVVVAGDGTATAVWTRVVGSADWTNSCRCNVSIWAATKQPGQEGFSAPVNISGTIDVTYAEEAGLTDLLISPNGTVTALWQTRLAANSSQPQLFAATRPAGSNSFSAPTRLLDGIGYTSFKSVAGPDGSLAVAYQRSDNGQIAVIRREKNSLNFSAPIAINEEDATGLTLGSVVVEDNGAITVVYQTGRNTFYKGRETFLGYLRIKTATIAAGQLSVTSTATALSRDCTANDNCSTLTTTTIDGAAAGAGRLVVLTTSQGKLQVARRNGGSQFETAITVDEYKEGEYISDSKITVGGDGTAFLIWQRWADEIKLQVRSLAPDANALTASTTLSTVSNDLKNQHRRESWFKYIDLTALPDGRASASWIGSSLLTDSGYRLVTSSNPTRALTVEKTGNGSGTIASNPNGIDCGTSCQYSFAWQSKVTLTASPDSKSNFAGWAGACAGDKTSCQVSLDQARSATATFVDKDNPDPNKPRTSSVKSKISKKGVVIISKVIVSGAGRISQRAVSGKKKVKVWCKTSKKVSKAGSYQMSCKLGKAGRKALRKRTLKLTLQTSFTPKGGKAVKTKQAVVIKKKR